MSLAYELRAMTIEDYPAVYKLWMKIGGFGIRKVDDSEEGVARFLKRNPGTSVVAVLPEGKIVGTILCGNDGREGCMYHVCVHKSYRRQGIGKNMAEFCMRALMKEGISRVHLIAFKDNQAGNQFWTHECWRYRDDANYYVFSLNDENITKFNPKQETDEEQ